MAADVQLTFNSGVRLSKGHARNVLLANQVRRGRPRVGLAHPRERAASNAERDRAMAARANADDEVFYMDDVDIDLNPIGTTYMRRGKQVVVLTPGKNVKRYLAGALNARTC